jgi:hypothetical protein
LLFYGAAANGVAAASITEAADKRGVGQLAVFRKRKRVVRERCCVLLAQARQLV